MAIIIKRAVPTDEIEDLDIKSIATMITTLVGSMEMGEMDTRGSLPLGRKAFTSKVIQNNAIYRT
jgi:hypothetical protein